MRNILLCLLALFMLCGCTREMEHEQSENDVTITENEQDQENNIVEEHKEEQEIPMTDDGKIIFLPGSDVSLVYEIARQFDGAEVLSDSYLGCTDYTIDYHNEFYSIDCSASSDGIAYIKGLAGSGDKVADGILLTRCINLALHDNPEYVFEDVRDWVLDNMDQDVEKKFGDANVHVRKVEETGYYFIEIYTDGYEWWENKLMHELMNMGY